MNRQCSWCGDQCSWCFVGVWWHISFFNSFCVLQIVIMSRCKTLNIIIGKMIADDPDLLFSRIIAELFCNACVTHDIKLARLFVSTHPTLFGIEFDALEGKITSFFDHSQKERLWHLRRQSVWMASDEAPPNLLQQIPEDVSRWIIQKYL